MGLHTPAPQPLTEARLLGRIEAELGAFRRHRLLEERGEPLTKEWAKQIKEQPGRFIRPDGTVDAERLRNFRRQAIFLKDAPSFDLTPWTRWTLLGGGRRGSVRMLEEDLATLTNAGFEDVLERHPCSPVGHPHIFRSNGYAFTMRWLRHAYFIGLLRRVLGGRLPSDVIELSIGSGYGVFSSLMKREYPAGRCVLVDFPEQLLLAYYFLGRNFPSARIAGTAELGDQPAITREILEAYDFILIPCQSYGKLAQGSVDLVTNFVSFGEMTPHWFRSYIQGPAFTGAKWFFTVNRIQSRPTYDSDLTIVDYPIWDAAKRLHFGLCPMLSHYYERRRLFFMERVPFSPFFEYLGQI